MNHREGTHPMHRMPVHTQITLNTTINFSTIVILISILSSHHLYKQRKGLHNPLHSLSPSPPKKGHQEIMVCPSSPSAFLPILISLALLLPTGHPIARPSASSEVAGCGPQLLFLAPCTPFVQGAMPIPADACCDNLVNLFHDQPGCLCPLLNRSLSLPVNNSLVLQLPILCHLSLSFNSNACPGLSLPPASSPQPQAIAGSNTSSPSVDVPGSPAIASPPPLRMNNLLRGVNCGGKLRVEGASLTSAIMPLVLAGALSV